MVLSPKTISLFTVLLCLLLFSQEGWTQRPPDRSRQGAWSRNWKGHSQWERESWSNGAWNRWRRNNHYYTYGWGYPYYSYGWYGYQLPSYYNYWPSYPSTFATYSYPSYPYNGKWYTGNWATYETPYQAFRNTGYYSGSP